jgi:WD40 repeat protein
MAEKAKQARADRTSVFLSYSRADSAFVERLAQTLETRGFVAIFDRSQKPQDDPDLVLAAQDEWWLQLTRMIAAADVMIFVVSPESAGSRVCDDEISHAKALGKRIIAVERRSIDFNLAPERLRSLNVLLSFASDDKRAFEATMTRLVGELQRNMDWQRAGQHFTRLAQKWQEDAKSPGLLLPSGAIQDAEAWIARRPLGEEAPGALIEAFIAASREKDLADRRRLQRVTGMGFLEPAQLAVRDKAYDRAVKLAAAGMVLSEDFASTLVPERGAVAFEALAQQHALMRITHAPEGGFALHPSGTELALFDGVTGHVSIISPCHESLGSIDAGGVVAGALFALSGDRLALALASGGVEVWDYPALRQRYIVPAANAPVRMQMSDDGQALLIEGGGSARLFSDAGAILVERPAAPGGAHIDATGQYLFADRRVLKFEHGVLVSETNHDAEQGVIGHGAIGAAYGEATIVVEEDVDEHASSQNYWVYASAPRVIDRKTGAKIELNIPAGARQGIGPVVVARDGSRVALVYKDGVELWDASTGERVVSLTISAWSSRFAKFSPDSAKLLIRDGGAGLHLLDAKTGDLLLSLREADLDFGREFQMSRRGERLAGYALDGSLLLFDLAHTRTVARFEHDADIAAVAYAPSGAHVATFARDHQLRVWRVDGDCEAAAFTWSHPHEAIVRNLKWAGDVLLAKDSESAWAFPMSGGQVRQYGNYHDQLSSADVSADGAKLALLFHDDRIEIRNALSGEEIAQWASGKDQGLARVRLSMDATHLAVLDSRGGAQIWRIDDRRLIASTDCRSDFLAMAWRPDGGAIWVATLEGAYGFELSGTRRDLSFEGKLKRPVECSLQAGRFAACSNGWLHVWDLEDSRSIASIETGQDYERAAVLTPDGTRVLVTSKNRIVLWDIDTGAPVFDAAGEEYGHKFAQFCPSGNLLFLDAPGSTIIDVRALQGLSGNVAVDLAASLKSDRAVSAVERVRNIVMTMAPDDLYAPLLLGASRGLNVDPTHVEKVLAEMNTLRCRRLHSNCYLTSTQRAKTDVAIVDGMFAAPPSRTFRARLGIHGSAPEAGTVSTSVESAPVEPRLGWRWPWQKPRRS